MCWQVVSPSRQGADEIAGRSMNGWVGRATVWATVGVSVGVTVRGTMGATLSTPVSRYRQAVDNGRVTPMTKALVRSLAVLCVAGVLPLAMAGSASADVP